MPHTNGNGSGFSNGHGSAPGRVTRFTPSAPCPVCGGCDRDNRGEGRRCHGFLSSDGLYAHCSREEYSGGLPEEPESGTFAHRLTGECRCGQSHDRRGTPPPPAAKPPASLGRPVAFYDYQDAAGNLLFQVVRYEPKTFRQRRRGLAGEWTYSLGGMTPVLYRLPKLMAANPDNVVYVVEGEKDVATLEGLGALATCNPGGAGKWRPEYAEVLRGRHVVILPDNDVPGRDHARKVAVSLIGLAASLRIVDLAAGQKTLERPPLPDKADVTDWIAAGGTLDDLEFLAGRPESDVPEMRDATVADLRKKMAETAWVYRLWIPNAALTLFAAQAGTGKTRWCFDLHRRIRHQLDFPDGSPMTIPPDAKFLWVVADNQHQELCDLAREFDIPDDRIILNTSALDPFDGTSLQTEDELADFEARIRRVRPVLVVIDTITNTGDFKSQDSSDAKRQYKPLQEIALRCRVPILCITHLNISGKVLGRRASEKVRVVIQMDCPDPEGQPHRRKLWVEKSKALKPPALGVTMGDGGNTYDNHPPVAPDPEATPRRGDNPRGSDPAKLRKAKEWLAERLEAGPERVSHLRRAAEDEGIAAGSLYRAREALKIHEFETDGKKWWELPDGPAAID